MKPGEVAKWSSLDWITKVKYAMPSGGGAVGVVFVWAEGMPNKPNPKPGTSSFVVKPAQGSSAPTKFAEYILRKVAGAASPHTKGVAHDNNGPGKAIETMLAKFKNSEPDHAIRTRWQQVWPHYQSASSYLIQETQKGVREFSDEYRCLWGLSTLLANGMLMRGLGRLFVADAMIGNGDRLCAPNTGNIMFKGNGVLCSIDSSTVLTNYQSCMSQPDGSNAWHGEVTSPNQRTPENWAKGVTSMKTDGITTTAMPGFEMSMLFEPGKWWEKIFRGHLQDGLRHANMLEQDPEEYEWEQGKSYFMSGVAEGEKEMDKRLSGINWLVLKSNYKKYVSKYGGDPNLDWTNFKVRRLYYRSRRKGVSEDQAMSEVNAYVKRKLA